MSPLTPEQRKRLDATIAEMEAKTAADIEAAVRRRTEATGSSQRIMELERQVARLEAELDEMRERYDDLLQFYPHRE